MNLQRMLQVVVHIQNQIIEVLGYLDATTLKQMKFPVLPDDGMKMMKAKCFLVLSHQK